MPDYISIEAQMTPPAIFWEGWKTKTEHLHSENRKPKSQLL